MQVIQLCSLLIIEYNTHLKISGLKGYINMWFDSVIKNLSGQQIVNDSKTPSGKVHVGSLRGVLIHDAVYRALLEKKFDVKYTYGIDDYDPLDGLPEGAKPELVEMMGKPLCNIPAPEGSESSDLAEHHIAEFLEIFKKLNVDAHVYRLRDIYRSGAFNESIDAILSKADIVRKVYKEVSNAEKPSSWYPFQVICEKCGKIGTTEVSDYDGKEVSYHCRTDMVSWATGCNHKGKISPFDGNGKLPWKLEWVAKWNTFNITIEGAGKDHCTKGGSREVASKCLRLIFGKTPPLNVPYEFFLVSGAKMSSSKGVGVSAREMSDFLPEEILRFLMIRTPAKRTVNFSTDLDYVVKLYNDYDRLGHLSEESKLNDDQAKTLQMTVVDDKSTAYHPVGFSLLISLLQLPHLDVFEEVSKRTPDKYEGDKYQNSLRKRIDSAKYWLNNYSTPDQRLELQVSLPSSTQTLSDIQKYFLSMLAGKISTLKSKSENEYQQLIFDIARLTPIAPKESFEAVYTVLFDKKIGPKAGSLLSYMDGGFLIKRFKEVNYSTDGIWNNAMTEEELFKWMESNKGKLLKLQYQLKINALIPKGYVSGDQSTFIRGKGIMELETTFTDNKTHILRLLLSDFEGYGANVEDDKSSNSELSYIEEYSTDIVDRLHSYFDNKVIKKTSTINKEVLS